MFSLIYLTEINLLHIYIYIYIGFIHVLTSFESIIFFWDVSPFASRENRRFGGTYHLHLQVEKRKKTLAVTNNCSKLRRITSD
jgi:hypothetical protein